MKRPRLPLSLYKQMRCIFVLIALESHGNVRCFVVVRRKRVYSVCECIRVAWTCAFSLGSHC